MKLKIITLNIWNGGRLLPDALAFLKSEAADIVMLQEVYDGRDPSLADRFRTMEILKDELAYPHTAFGLAYQYIDRECDRPLPHGTAILSTFPIKSTGTEPMRPSTLEVYSDIAEHWTVIPPPLQHATVQTPAGEVNLYNMHGVWDLAGDDYSPDRRLMAKSILEAIAGKQNVIVGGDSNASQGNPLWNEIGRHLTDAFGGRLTSTFNMRRKDQPGYATAAVDVLYVSPNFKVVSAECPDVDVSDHLPLVVELEL